MKYFSIDPTLIYQNVEWVDQKISISQITSPALQQAHVENIKFFSMSKGKADLLPVNTKTQTEEFNLRMNEIYKYLTEMSKKTSRNGFFTIQVVLKDFYVVKNQIFVRAGREMLALYELNRDNERYLFGESYFNSISWDNITQIPETFNSLVMVSAGSPNWGHFLIDELPRICSFIEESNNQDEVLIYFTNYDHYSGHFNQNRSETIRLLFPNQNITCHFLDHDKVAYFKSSNYYSPINYHPFYKNFEFLQLPRSIYEKNALARRKEMFNRIFCLRKHGDRSLPLSQVDQLREIFEPLGYFFCFPEEHSVEKQFEIFSNAQFIIGIMGAGMCNSVFTPPSASLLYIAPNGWEETFFWNLANQLGHSYYVYYCNVSDESDNPAENSLNLDVQDFYDFFLTM